jgi:hypothetical protein
MRTMLRFKEGTAEQQQIYEAMKDRPLYASPPVIGTPAAWMADTGSVASAYEIENGLLPADYFHIPLYTAP